MNSNENIDIMRISLVMHTMDSLFKNIKDINLLTNYIKMNIGKNNYNYSILERNYKDIIPQLSQDELSELIERLDDAYYNTEEPLVTDKVYDFIREFYEETGLTIVNKTKKKIGAPVRGEKVKLPIHLGSMDKIKHGSNELKNFFQTYKNKKCISEKLDGISFLVDYSKPNGPFAYTRGDSELAQDKTYLLDYIKLPKIDDGYVRGELIISKQNWEKIKDMGKNARNYVSGLVNKKEVSIQQFKYVDFVAYEYYNPNIGDISVDNQFTKLKQLGFKVANNKTLDITIEQLLDTLVEFRNQSKYIIDGIIIADTGIHKRNTSGNPKYAKAFKDETQMETGITTVLDIEWTPSKDGKLKPVILLKPINLGGVTISRATGNNASFIVDNGIGKNSIVKIIRSGDVIPKVVEILEKKEPLLPNNYKYKWDTNHTDILLEDMEGNSTMLIKQIDHFIGTLGIEFFKIATITKAYENGIVTSIYDLFTITKNQLLKIDGIKDKSADKILSSIQSKLENTDIVTFLSGLPCFTGLGRKRIQLIYDNIPNFNKLDIDQLTNKIMLIDGFSNKLTEQFVNGMDECNLYIDAFTKNYKFISDKKETPIKLESKDLEKYIFVPTGFRIKPDSDGLYELIMNNGGKIGDSINKTTTHVVVKDWDSFKRTDKISKAEASGIKIVSIEDVKAGKV